MKMSLENTPNCPKPAGPILLPAGEVPHHQFDTPVCSKTDPSQDTSVPVAPAPARVWMFYLQTCVSLTAGDRSCLQTLPATTLQHSQELIYFCLQVNELKTKIHGLRQRQQQKYLSKTPNLANCRIYFTPFTRLMWAGRLLISGRGTRLIFAAPKRMMSSFNSACFSQSAFTLTCRAGSSQLPKGKTN